MNFKVGKTCTKNERLVFIHIGHFNTEFLLKITCLNTFFLVSMGMYIWSLEPYMETSLNSSEHKI